MRAKVTTLLVLGALVGALVPGRAPAADAPTIYDALAEMKDHRILVTAIREAGEVATLKGKGEYTVFAPTDAALRAVKGDLLKQIATNKAAVKALVNAHLLKGARTTDGLLTADRKDRTTLHGTELNVEGVNGVIRVGGAKIVVSNVRCANGVIHVIDAVLPLEKP